MHEKTAAFPSDIVSAAKDAHRATGCLASISLCQWALESGYGKYYAATNNPFGMKARNGQPFEVRRTHEYIRGNWITIEAKFRKFFSLTEAFIEHGFLLMDPEGPYRKALPYKDNWREYVRVMGPIYATDPHYVSKLVAIIEEWRLYEEDDTKLA